MHTGNAKSNAAVAKSAGAQHAAATGADSGVEQLIVPTVVAKDEAAAKRGRGRPAGSTLHGPVRDIIAGPSAFGCGSGASGASAVSDQRADISSPSATVDKHKRHRKPADIKPVEFKFADFKSTSNILPIHSQSIYGHDGLGPVAGAEKDKAVEKAKAIGTGEWKCKYVLESNPPQYISCFWDSGAVRSDIPPIHETEVEYHVRNIKQEDDGEPAAKRAKENQAGAKSGDGRSGDAKPTYNDGDYASDDDVKPLVIDSDK
jgi:hypothetical protein